MDTAGFFLIAAILVGFGLISKRIEGTLLTAPMLFTAVGLLVAQHGLGLIEVAGGGLVCPADGDARPSGGLRACPGAGDAAPYPAGLGGRFEPSRSNVLPEVAVVAWSILPAGRSSGRPGRPRAMRTVQLPPPVLPGDRVGVAALSGPVRPERLEAGLEALAGLGFEPVPAANLNLRSRHGLFAGSDAQRLAAFHELAADPGVQAIVFARGGHGVLRLLPRIDWELLARRPRAYVGYSDLTPFLLAVVERLRLVAFHGPMVAADLARGLDDAEERSLLDALAGRLPLEFRLEPNPGEPCEGHLLGGCLSLLTATLGTPWAARLDGALLFLEEANEPLYRFDRMLTHLRLSGSLAAVRGLVSGHLAGVGDAAEDERLGDEPSREVLRELARSLRVPWAHGLDAGHAKANLTLPLGLSARLDPATGLLRCGPRSAAPAGG